MTGTVNHRVEVADPSPLISVDRLAGLIGRSDVKVLDVRGHWATPPVSSFEEYAAGHIPGAIFVDWTKQFLETGGPINLAPVATRDNAGLAFEALGIHAGDLVVLYDDHHHMLAGRIWWAMRYWGFGTVKVLNGGWKAWNDRQGPVSIAPVSVEQGTFEPVEQADLLSDVEAVANRQVSTALIDARGPVGFAGTADDGRSGHIPGAINLPFKAMLDEETGLFLENDDLVAAFDRAAPGWRGGAVISSCGSGYAGTVVLLGLCQLGIDAPLFDGSIAVWKQDPSRPLQQG